LHVAPFLWSGAGGVITRLCEHQRREGPVVLVTTGSRDGLDDWRAYRSRLRRAGVTHHSIDFFHRSEDRFWSSATQLARLLRDLKPAVIHAHAGVPTCGAVVARGISGHRARLIGQMYSWGPDRPTWMNHQDAWGLGQADRVICSARAYWDLLVQHGVPARKLTYLPWGLPLELLPWRGVSGSNGHRGRESVSAAGPVIGFVGRIEPRKGQLALVEAFARLRDVYPAARLELIGPVADSSYAASLRAAITKHGLDKAVRLAGQVRDVAGHVRKWDLFVSLSADEGQGLAVLEAMAIGVPVAARVVAGISDFLIDGRTGMAIRGTSGAAVAKVLARLLARPVESRAVVRRARQLVERRYSWERTLSRFERLYWR
jgi:glycogen(starch) synthase